MFFKKEFLKSSRPSLPLKKAPPLTPTLSPQERGRKPPSGARNRYALWLAGHQSPAPDCAGWDRMETAPKKVRQIARAGTAWGTAPIKDSTGCAGGRGSV